MPSKTILWRLSLYFFNTKRNLKTHERKYRKFTYIKVEYQLQILKLTFYRTIRQPAPFWFFSFCPKLFQHPANCLFSEMELLFWRTFKNIVWATVSPLRFGPLEIFLKNILPYMMPLVISCLLLTKNVVDSVYVDKTLNWNTWQHINCTTLSGSFHRQIEHSYEFTIYLNFELVGMVLRERMGKFHHHSSSLNGIFILNQKLCSWFVLVLIRKTLIVRT